MYHSLLITHNILRWVALACLVYTTIRAFIGYQNNKSFSRPDNAFRHWTATIVQIQLTVGFILYFNSPFVSSYWNGMATPGDGSAFFALVHLAMMFIAVTIISIGSALAKRKETNHGKYKTMLVWFAIGLLIILIAIPWPFSPLVQRPYFR